MASRAPIPLSPLLVTLGMVLLLLALLAASAVAFMILLDPRDPLPWALAAILVFVVAFGVRLTVRD